MTMKRMTPRKFVGAGAKIILAGVVLAFLGLQSINFFTFTFPPEQWFYAYLGFGLTSGGVIGYLVIFKNDADTHLKKTIAVVMLGVCVVGEILTAGFGMQVEALGKAGYSMTASDFKFMIMAVQALGLLHGLALLFYYAGDQIIELFQDDDKDGIPNAIDRDWKPRKAGAMASEVNPTNGRKQ